MAATAICSVLVQVARAEAQYPPVTAMSTFGTYGRACGTTRCSTLGVNRQQDGTVPAEGNATSKVCMCLVDVTAQALNIGLGLVDVNIAGMLEATMKSPRGPASLSPAWSGRADRCIGCVSIARLEGDDGC